MEQTIPPIKRHEAIVQFSREHHFGLLLVWKIRQGLKAGLEPERIAKYALYFFEEDLKAHFEEEERVLFSKMKETDGLKIKALREHREIFNIIAELQLEKNNPGVLTAFADALDRHIRFEERELFNHLQAQLTDDELTTLAAEHPPRTNDPDLKWADHFWVKKH